MSSTPNIFISSTYFDLKQVREDLGAAIRDMGFNDIRSELGTFPIDPNLNTVDNCRRAVDLHADVLVLIIGGRYGYVSADAGKSVTNIEYLTARAKGIPIYVFVERKLIDLLPIFRENPQADFSSVVDNPRVFEFITLVRDEHRVWTYPFDYARDIAAGLRNQLAQRLGDALRVIALIEGVEQAWMKSLSPDSFRLAAEQPTGWEYLLFAQGITDSIHRYKDLRLRHQYRISYGPADVHSVEQIPGFISQAMDENGRLVRSFETLMGPAVTEALGAPGVPGDARKLAFVAQEIGEVYHQALLWAQRIRRASNIDTAADLIECVASFADCFIEPIEAYGPYCLREIRRGLSEGTKDKPVQLNLVLTLGTMNIDDYLRLLREFAIANRLPIGSS